MVSQIRGVRVTGGSVTSLLACVFFATAAATYAVHADPLSVGSAPQNTTPALALPDRLGETGLYIPGTRKVRPEVVPFSPQYPLWSDGATKRRWLYLPPGSSIDASRPEAWEFPRGTRLWKEFAYEGALETRYIERMPDGSWRYATYIWNAEGTDAGLAPADGATLSVASAPRGRYSIPGEADCRACHEGAAVPVLGFGALQLSPDRDPLAPHAEASALDLANLRTLVARGLVRNLPAKLLENPPRIAAATPTERATLGYLHGNCGHCHNDVGPLASLDLVLAQDPVASSESSAKALRSLVGQASRFRPHGIDATRRVEPGRQDTSVLAVRMRSRNPMTQMPPLGTQLADADGLSLVQRWINDLPVPESQP
jgi:hypothetical protein